MITENEKNKKYAEKLSELILSNPTLNVVAMIDTDGIDDDYSCMVGNLHEPRIETIAINYDNVYITKEGDDYDDCCNYYGCECDDWGEAKFYEKAKAIPWEDVIAIRVSAL